MILLRILFFAIGGISGYQIVDSFYSYPINSELTNEVYYLEAEILKKEEELVIEKEAEEEKINKSKKEKINHDKIPDPIVDNIWINCVSYCFYGFLLAEMFDNMCDTTKIFSNYFFIPLLKTIFIFVPHENTAIILTLSFFLSVLIFFVKITLSLFSSLVFNVHDFWWNLSESYNLIFYLKKGWQGIVTFLFGIALLIFGFGSTIFWHIQNNQHQNMPNNNRHRSSNIPRNN